MRVDQIKRQISADALSAGRAPNGWNDFLARLAAFTATLPPEGMAEPEFARRVLPVMDHEQETLLSYLHRAGHIWRRRDGIDRLVFARRPDSLRGRGRPPRSKPVNAVEREIHRAFSEGMTGLVDAIDHDDTSGQRLAAAAIMKAAARLIRRRVTWAEIRAALRIYRPDVVARLRRHESAFDSRSGECAVDAPVTVSRSSKGASLVDRILRAIKAAGPSGSTRSRLLSVIRIDAAALTAELVRLEAEGVLIARRARGEGQGSRSVVRYSLGSGRYAEIA